MNQNKVLVIGWDAADWKAINPLIEQGYMPNLRRMMTNGVSGKLATLDPPLSPMLWTSIATGKRPYKHGILGFTEVKEDGSGIQPVLNTNRRCKAIWNILTQLKKKTHVVGWWPSHPAEPINGIAISNFYQKAHLPKNEGDVLEDWPFMDNSIHPTSMEDIFAKLRVHPLEFTAAHILPFLPHGAELDQSDPLIQKLIDSLRKIMADCCTIHSAITYILENEDWDFTGVYYDAIDHFGHGFMKFHPPQMDHIPDHLFRGFHNVINAGYRLHDMFLGRLLDMVGDETDVLLISDHGFHPDNLRLEKIPGFPAAAAMEHSKYGIIVGQGPSFKKNENIIGASLIDITPTLLHLYDLPVGEDMDGKVLKGLFNHEKEVKVIESWEAVEGACGMHSDEVRKDQQIDKETMEQLIELGYIERPHPNANIAIQRTLNESNFWLAKSYIDGNLLMEAIPILEQLFNDNTEQARYGHLLASIYNQVGKVNEANKILDIISVSSELDVSNQLLHEAKSLLSKKETVAAIDKFNQVESEHKDHPELYISLGQAHLQLNQYDLAESNFNKALELDPQSHLAFAGMGSLLFLQKKYQPASEAFIESLSLIFNQPQIHYHLGECLEHLGNEKGAAQAFQAAIDLSQRASMFEQQKANIFSSVTGNSKSDAKTLTIVSGLPRSGTSMMMQIMEKAGYDIFKDGIRIADDNNPKGYYEHERIKNLSRDKSVLEEIEEKSVTKIIAQLLLFLPKKFNYRIIFMMRDIHQVLQSQDKMLQRLSKTDDSIKNDRSDDALKESYQKTIQRIMSWSQAMPNVDLIFLNYAEVVSDPIKALSPLSEFLNKSLNIEELAHIVDPNLYRERNVTA